MSVDSQAAFLGRLANNGFDLSVFYDIGANIGRWTRSVAKFFPDARYELFEPLHKRLEGVDAGLSLVGSEVNWNVHDVALGDSSGATRIKILGDLGVGSSTLILDSDIRKPIEIFDVPSWRLDDYVANESLPYPDMMKLDTQASEVLILRGAEKCLKHAKFALVETWFRRVYGPDTPLFVELCNVMDGFGWQLYDVLLPEDGRDVDGTLRWGDAAFVNRAHFSQSGTWY